jgi:hypothetical protein
MLALEQSSTVLDTTSASLTRANHIAETREKVIKNEIFGKNTP